jgi:hypothetical protein
VTSRRVGRPGRTRAPEVVPSEPRAAVREAGAPAEPVVRILPLGSGLVLIGLGLALALLGLRLRREGA